jgi:hypothetical protein
MKWLMCWVRLDWDGEPEARGEGIEMYISCELHC